MFKNAKKIIVKKLHDQTDLIRNKFPSFHAEKVKKLFFRLSKVS